MGSVLQEKEQGLGEDQASQALPQGSLRWALSYTNPTARHRARAVAVRPFSNTEPGQWLSRPSPL